jgi:hypothetical protein
MENTSVLKSNKWLSPAVEACLGCRFKSGKKKQGTILLARVESLPSSYGKQAIFNAVFQMRVYLQGIVVCYVLIV